MCASEFDHGFMRRALELAARGRGFVEPNPMVGCVIANGERLVAEGWHQRFGGPHAEIEALRDAGEPVTGMTMYVTLEPCCHHGKTPPCTDAIIQAGIGRVVVAMLDPFNEVNGGGMAKLEQAGIRTERGLLEEQARDLNAPYIKLVNTGRPWVIAKWAMTLDGKIATRSGDSQWISSEESRAIAHELRGRVDGILVGRATVAADDPLLTARPAGPRVATRIVMDSKARTPLDSQVVRTANETPTLIVVGEDSPVEQRGGLESAGCEVFVANGPTRSEQVSQVLDELGRRRMTNVLVEGGGEVLGAFFDAGAVDEVHVFVAPKIIGGDASRSPIGGRGIDRIAQSISLGRPLVQQLDGDVYISGRL